MKKEIVLVPNWSVSLPTTLPAETHIGEEQFVLEEQILNTEKYVIYLTGTRRPVVSPTGRTKFRIKVNLNKEQCTNVTPPLT
jgi:hypothetical protein